jgi:hypothetical protein
MSSLFCGSAIKMAANAAGLAVAIQNPAMATSIMPVALVLQAKIDGGSDNAVLNGLIQQGITDLLGKVSTNPIIMVEANAILGLLNFDAVTGKLPTIKNATIKEVVDSFMLGMKAAAVKV